jgi:hypothetical protein
MPVESTVLDLSAALQARLRPAVTRWNRLEGRPRTHRFDRALRAEVRDALWFLTRQWQLGEFLGDDAGSPVSARICTQSTRLDRYQAAGGAVGQLDFDRPLEATVERRPVQWRFRNRKLALDLRLAAGRHFRKLLVRAQGAGELTADYSGAYRSQYPIDLPNPLNRDDATICAHVEAWQMVSAVAGREMDGVALLEHLADPAHGVADGIGAAPADEEKLAELAAALGNWLAGLVLQPEAEDEDAWLPQKMEYQFGCSAPLVDGDYVARAEEYYHGHLDWYAFERTASAGLGGTASGGAASAPAASSFVPSPLSFAGMPNTRWWSFEEGRTNFGQVRPDRTDLGKLLLIEFGLTHANDWFVLPFTLPIGSATRVHGIAVTNVFGERIWVEPVAVPKVPAPQRWSLYGLTGDEQERALLLVPSTGHVLVGKPIEEVALVRDEMANLAYAIERVVPLPIGTGKPGGEAARELFARLEQIVGPPPAPPAPLAPVRYQLMTSVPEHWIPFIPVRLPGTVRETRLQRAAMPRPLGTDPGGFEPVEPRTGLLRPGLDATPRLPYYIDEEEVPRAGVIVSECYQRTRWLDGRVLVWRGVRKTTGRGEASSGLAFDQLAPTA